PYDDQVMQVHMSGAQIAQMLSSLAMRKHGLLGVAGLTYTWDYNSGRIAYADPPWLVPHAGSTAPDMRMYIVLLTDYLLTWGDGCRADDGFKSLRDQALQAVTAHPQDFPHNTPLVGYYIWRRSPIQEVPLGQARFPR